MILMIVTNIDSIIRISSVKLHNLKLRRMYENSKRMDFFEESLIRTKFLFKRVFSMNLKLDILFFAEGAACL